MNNTSTWKLFILSICIFLNTNSHSQPSNEIVLFDKSYIFHNCWLNYSPDSTVYVVLEKNKGINNVKLITKKTEINYIISEEKYYAQTVIICVSNDSRYFISRLTHDIGSDGIYVNEYYSNSGVLVRRDTVATRYLNGNFVSSGDFVLQYTITNEPYSMILSKTFKFQLIDINYNDAKDLHLERGKGLSIKKPYSQNNNIIIPFLHTDSVSNSAIRDSLIFRK